jgi:dihydrofolate synthase/folylpolyglutamate synthase
MADYARAVEYLLALKKGGVRPGLERMTRFVAELGNPERRVPCVHVAGTNGKGSVSAMLESVFRTAGWRTGLYTSPHLVRLGERIQVNRRLLPPEEIATWTEKLQPVANRLTAEGAGPSYFEFMTAMAFTHFAQESCDIAIIETGLGGRLDATNVVLPEVSVITSIGLDHRDLLGPDLAAIAREKAGIIKPKRPVVIGRLPPVAEKVVRDIAVQRESPVTAVPAEFGTEVSRYPVTNLEGDYQRVNAATATLAARQMEPRWRLAPDVIARGLQQVDWPGRWHRVQVGERRVILDAAHNEEGAAALEKGLAALRKETGRAPIIIMGALGADRARPLLEVGSRQAAEIFFVVPAQTRACGFAELEALLPVSAGIRTHRSSVAELFPAPDTCTAGTAGDTLVVTGSIYLLGEVLARLEPDRGDLEDRLQDF